MANIDNSSIGELFDAELRDHRKDEVEEIYRGIEARLNYRYDLPDERLLPAHEYYDLYMCRTNVIDGLVKDTERFLALADPQKSGVQEVRILLQELTDLAAQTRSRLKTAADMQIVKAHVNMIVEICKSLK